ncbi:unnamed protein product [Phytophthora lilii]|uniref:Unnamed protein product n=1 Tax=Phytophthora lilii TaxID=2077276 RepID=A0A9W6TQL7_9STRA|nr:unnamed protein product [Phytophthora lilii]
MELSPEDEEQCQNLTAQLLEETLHDFEEMNVNTADPDSHSCLKKTRWKKLKSNPEVTVYSDRKANSAWLSVMRPDDWEYPIAVTALGRMKYSVDDVLLALFTPNIAAQRLRSFLVNRRPEKNCRFVRIVGSTQTTPFQLLVVTRFVITQSWPFTMFKSPQEMVLACASGVVTSASGKRYGYEMVQSIPLHFKNSDNKSLPRTQVIQSKLFCEQPDGSVFVFNRMVVDAKTRLSSLKQNMLCRASMSFWKFVPRSLETKKLWWCVRNKGTLIRGLPPSHEEPCESVSCASNETEENSRCEFCEAWLCGGFKCHKSRQLKMFLSSETGIYKQILTLCARCVEFVQSRDAADVARAELAEVQPTSYGSAASFTKAAVDLEGDTFSSTSASYSSTES